MGMGGLSISIFEMIFSASLPVQILFYAKRVPYFYCNFAVIHTGACSLAA